MRLSGTFLTASSNWFFLGEELYRVLAINRIENYVKAYSYAEERVKYYKWDEILQIKEAAYSNAQVGELINRTPRTMRHYIKVGVIKPTATGQRKKGIDRYFYNKRDVMRVRDAVEEYAKGGRRGVKPLPTREQLRNMLAVGGVLYLKDGDDFVPVWEARF